MIVKLKENIKCPFCSKALELRSVSFRNDIARLYTIGYSNPQIQSLCTEYEVELECPTCKYKFRGLALEPKYDSVSNFLELGKVILSGIFSEVEFPEDKEFNPSMRNSRG